MRMSLLILVLFGVMLIAPCLGHPTEASGQITRVLAGNVLIVKIIDSEEELISIPHLSDSIKVRLADIDCMEKNTQEGLDALNYTNSFLGEYVFLDMGRERNYYKRFICVLYLQNESEGLAPIPRLPCLNRLLVDSGHAVVDDRDNEFNPEDWWT